MPRPDRSQFASRQDAEDGRAAGDAVLTAGKGLSSQWLDQPLVGREATAIAYLRRSSDRQGQSLADQRQAIRRHAGEADLRVVREYADDAVSGADSAPGTGVLSPEKRRLGHSP